MFSALFSPLGTTRNLATYLTTMDIFMSRAISNRHFLLSSYHYQKIGSSRRLETVRKGLKTVRNTIPDGHPSGTSRHEPVVRKDPFFLTVGRQEYFPDGSSWRSVFGWKFWLIPDGWTVRKLANEAKKIIYTNGLASVTTICQLHQIQLVWLFTCYIQITLSSISYWNKINKWEVHQVYIFQI
jgi:hypothetical protein